MIARNELRSMIQPLSGAVRDYDALMEQIGESRFVLIGEASHGTHEFYRERAVLTKRLILENGFSAVAIEGDWPDASRVHRYVTGESSDADAVDALSGFQRFPSWMWRNADVLDFVGWLREHNDGISDRRRRAGFYGLDLYSLHASIEAVVAYLDKVDPAAAVRARRRYACFDGATRDPQEYGYATELGLAPSCEDEAVSQLIELRRATSDYSTRDGRLTPDDFFFAEQNARVVKNAEEYYRSMFHGRVLSWNLRDRHMVEILGALQTYLSSHSTPAKIVVWAHNSHVGDARATEMGTAGEWNVGELVRKQHGSQSFLLGMTTFEGTVTAATDWHAPAERKRVRPAFPGSYEALFHDLGHHRFLLPLRGSVAADVLRNPLLERAIGVIYRPDTERESHYFHASLSEQFDAVLHIDHTRAVEPLERSSEWTRGEVPETFPMGV